MEADPQPRWVEWDGRQTRSFGLATTGPERDAVYRAVTDIRQREHTLEVSAELRNAGFAREATITELVATSPDAAALVRLLSGTWQREFRTRLRVTAVTQAVVVSVLVHPVAPLLLLAGLVGWGSIWLSQRRRALGDADWHLLVDWWLDPLRSWTAHRWLLLLALGPSTGLAIGYIGEAAWGPAAASAAVALLLALFFRRALHPRSKWTAPVNRRSPRRRTR